MKKIFMLFVLVALSSPFLAQELANTSINKVDAQGRKQGSWKTFDVNGNLKFEGTFVDGIPVGTFTFYYEDGTVKAVSEMYDQGRRSHTRIYHPNSRLMAEGNYLNEKKDSIWNYYSDFDGVLLSTEQYEDGLLEGKVINYYPKGGVAEEISYHAGQKHGEWKRYFTDGKLKLKAAYVDDRLEGLMLVYYQNGVPEISGMYRHNYKDGIWMYFNDKGEVVKKERYEKGFLKETEIPDPQ